MFAFATCKANELHAAQFRRQRIDADALSSLEDAHFIELGITAVGDRAKLRKKVKEYAAAQKQQAATRTHFAPLLVQPQSNMNAHFAAEAGFAPADAGLHNPQLFRAQAL